MANKAAQLEGANGSNMILENPQELRKLFHILVKARRLGSKGTNQRSQINSN